jgi:hypothetical protein
VPDRLYHYTTKKFARECAADMDAGRGVWLEASDGLYGPGIYALDLGYEDASRDDLRWECFGDARPEHPMDGALVLDPALSDEPFEHVEGRIWLMDAPGKTPSFVDGLIVAIATWSAGEWTVASYE